MLLALAVALAGCGSVDAGATGPVTCPNPIPTCGDTPTVSANGTLYYVCGDMVIVEPLSGSVCCLQGEPAGYVPVGNECAAQ